VFFTNIRNWTLKKKLTGFVHADRKALLVSTTLTSVSGVAVDLTSPAIIALEAWILAVLACGTSKKTLRYASIFFFTRSPLNWFQFRVTSSHGIYVRLSFRKTR